MNEITEAENFVIATAAARGWSPEDCVRLMCEFIEDLALEEDLFNFLASQPSNIDLKEDEPTIGDLLAVVGAERRDGVPDTENGHYRVIAMARAQGWDWLPIATATGISITELKRIANEDR